MKVSLRSGATSFPLCVLDTIVIDVESARNSFAPSPFRAPPWYTITLAQRLVACE